MLLIWCPFIISDRTYTWPRKQDVDEIEEKFIFAKDIKFEGEFPSAVVPIINIESLYDEFIEKLS